MKIIKPFTTAFKDFPVGFLQQLDASFQGLREALTPYIVTANYTFTDRDKIDSLQVDATGSNITITLPAPAGDRRRRIIKTDATTNTVTLTAGGTILINAATTYVLSSQFDFVEVEPTGTGWLIIDRSAAIPGPVFGTITNDNAAAGYVGEFVESIIPSGSAVGLTSPNAANITSLSLTAGDWDVWGIVYFYEAATTTATLYSTSVTTTSGSIPTTDLGIATRSRGTGAVAVGNPIHSELTNFLRLSLASTTTVYLCGASTFAVSTMTAYGALRARRRR